MTLSPASRTAEERELLIAFAREIADGYCLGHFHGPREEAYAKYGTTTWVALAQTFALEPKHSSGGPQYALTPRGWLMAQRFSGQLESAETRARAVTLARAIKALIKGRDSHIGALLDERTLSGNTGLPVGWIYNALSSQLLNDVFPHQDMTVTYEPRHRAFRAPPTFGAAVEGAPVKQLVPQREHFAGPEQLSPAWELRKGFAVAACTIWSNQLGFELRLSITGDDLPRTQVVCSQEDLIRVQEEWRAAMEEKGWTK